VVHVGLLPRIHEAFRVRLLELSMVGEDEQRWWDGHWQLLWHALPDAVPPLFLGLPVSQLAPGARSKWARVWAGATSGSVRALGLVGQEPRCFE
jgi:hypothetical protein